MSVDREPYDRRRGPRVEVPADTTCFLEMRARVQLIDISLGGALLGSDIAAPSGTRAQLRTGLAAGRFATGIEIRRDAGPRNRSAVHALGAAFVDMDEQSRRSLEAFLRKANQ
jgi:hypothetical protein